MKYKHQPTEAQRQAAKARREALTNLAKEASKLSSEQLREFFPNPVTTIEGKTLSPHNTYLVLRQNPSATLVGGFEQWRKAKRHVVKGAKALGIWVPAPKAESPATESATPSDPANTKPRFIFGNVFDISQTAELTEKETTK